MTTPNFQFPTPNFQHNYQAPYLGVGSWWLGVATLSRSPFIRRRVRLCCTWTGQQAREKSASSSCLAGRHTRLHQRRIRRPETPARVAGPTMQPRPFRVRTGACPARCCRMTGNPASARRSRRPRTCGCTRGSSTRKSAYLYLRGRESSTEVASGLLPAVPTSMEGHWMQESGAVVTQICPTRTGSLVFCDKARCLCSQRSALRF